MGKRVDWVALEPHYRAGIRSLSDMAKEFGCSDAAIVQHARREGWARNARTRQAVVMAEAEKDMGRSGFVYVPCVEAEGRRFFKVGMAVHFDTRLKTHQCSSPFEVRAAACYFVGNMRSEEAELHEMFADKRVRGEWFSLDDADLTTIALRARLL